jgi:hypothetical protein
MATRSLTKILNNNQLVLTYTKHWDGYPEGYGKDLATFLQAFKGVNGLNSDQPKKVYNGIGCLAAQIVAHFKDGPGDIYIEPGSDYEFCYTVNFKSISEPLEFTCQEDDEVLFKGSPQDFLVYLNEHLRSRTT